jgi:hypothetical protein
LDLLSIKSKDGEIERLNNKEEIKRFGIYQSCQILSDIIY